MFLANSYIDLMYVLDTSLLPLDIGLCKVKKLAVS
jgi:hypothetical protein